MPPSSSGGPPERRPDARRFPRGMQAPQGMAVRAAVLDVDGTVATCPYDFDAMRSAVAAVARKWGIEIESAAVRGIVEQIAEIGSRLGDDGAEFREEAEATVCALEVAPARQAALLPGVAEALRRLRGDGVAVSLITRNCRAASELVLRGFQEYDLLLTRDDVPRVKPDPDHVLRSLAPFGARAERAVLVGDHVYDMQAGRAAGIRFCVGVKTGSSSEQGLWEAGADDVIESAADLPDWLLARAEDRP